MMVNQENGNFNLGSLNAQNLFGFLRVLTLFGILYIFPAFCSTVLHDVDPREVAQVYIDRVPILGLLPEWLLILFGAAFNPIGLRYMLPPLAAFFLIMIAGAYYVKDVYALPHLKQALRYITASMFTVSYPTLKIDRGVKQIKENEVNLIDRVGGPGFVSIEPGSAAIFRHLREPGPSLIATTHFMAPFETIAQTVDLDEQQGESDEIRTVTRDGIVVVLRDVHVRYRIKHDDRNGIPVQRSLAKPYPLDENALPNMLFNLSVQNDGNVDDWKLAVERAITGAIAENITSRTIDFLTAPRDGIINPRVVLSNQLMNSMRQRLGDLGAELLWADVGHIDIDQELVDEQRTSLWASDWVGDTTASRAYTEAIRQAYQELGRAQAQAEIIMSIADALNNANLPDNNVENVRRLFLARTAQVLDSLSTETKKLKS